jgi:L-lactate dehydrogenase (cytochrome)
MNMRLLGAQTIKDVGPELIDASSISTHIAPIPGDRLYDNNCEFTAWLYQSVLTLFHR